jgi:hypothetical protein
MPRIIVTTDPTQLSDDSPVLLEESVHSVHLSTDHAAAQLIERLAWAIGDAEVAERRGAMRAGARSASSRSARPHRQGRSAARRQGQEAAPA